MTTSKVASRFTFRSMSTLSEWHCGQDRSRRVLERPPVDDLDMGHVLFELLGRLADRSAVFEASCVLDEARELPDLIEPEVARIRLEAAADHPDLLEIFVLPR